MRDTIDMAREAGARDWQRMNSDVEYMMSSDALKAFEALVRADERSVEREACAKVAEDFLTSGRSPLGRSVADAIRARLEQPEQGCPHGADSACKECYAASVQELVSQDVQAKCRLEVVPAKGGLLPTPPAAPVQESMTWVERWYGSGPDQGWWIWERHSLTHGQAVARIGTGPFAERLTSIIVEKHNAALFPTELVKEPFAPDPHNGTGPTPPAAQRQWVGLTDEEKQEWIDAMPYTIEPRHCMILVNVMEAKLKEKNTTHPAPVQCWKCGDMDAEFQAYCKVPACGMKEST